MSSSSEASKPSEEESSITKARIRDAIDKLLPTVELATTSLNKFRKLLSSKCFDGTDLREFNAFIKVALKEAIYKQNDEEEESESEEEEETPKMMSKRKQCAACREAKELDEFSKSQLGKGGLGRCKGCVSSNSPAKGTTTQPAAKKARTVTPVAKKPIVTHCCSKCEKEQVESRFPIDKPEEAPTCVQCIKDGIPRKCFMCEKEKTKDEFSHSDWNHYWITSKSVKKAGKLNNNTMREIENLCKDVGAYKCKACRKIEWEKANAAALAEKLREEKVLLELGVAFYDFASVIDRNNPKNHIQYSKARPNDLAGKYDVVFHAGWALGEDIENRTTKGSAVLKVDSNAVVTGTVEFVPELQLSKNLCFQRDFELLEGSHGTDREEAHWACDLKVTMVDADVYDVVHCCEEEIYATLSRIEKRVALPWIKYENAEDNEDENHRVTFDTLEQAEEIAHNHKGGVKRVFFLEPGDLHLHVDWTNDHIRETVCTDCILRKKT